MENFRLPKNTVPLIFNTIAIAVFTAMATGAFTARVSRKVKERAGNRSEWSGRNDRPLESSHVNHRRNKFYNTPENGECITDLEHLALHIYFRGHEAEIGLSPKQNESAIGALLERVLEFNRRNGLTTQRRQIMCQVEQIIAEFLDDRYEEAVEA